jgi:hypothetical protein
MPRWIAVHADGRYASVDADQVIDLRAADPANPNFGSLLKLRDGDEMRVDEALPVMRLLLGRPGLSA